MKSRILPAFAAVLFSLSALAGGPPDFSKISRNIEKRPAFVADQPLYGLFLFGKDRELPIWAVLDKSKKDSSVYDVLYLDLNADGDLTAPAKRFAGKPDKESKPGAERMNFNIGQFKEPGSDRTHTGLNFTWTKQRTFYQMKWLGDKEIIGPFSTDPQGTLNFANSAEAAPIFVPGLDGPVQFQHWTSGTLTRGGETEFMLFIGNPGSVPGAFTAVDDTFLPAGDFVMASVFYKDKSGELTRIRCELRRRC